MRLGGAVGTSIEHTRLAREELGGTADINRQERIDVIYEQRGVDFTSGPETGTRPAGTPTAPTSTPSRRSGRPSSITSMRAGSRWALSRMGGWSGSEWSCPRPPRDRAVRVPSRRRGVPRNGHRSTPLRRARPHRPRRRRYRDRRQRDTIAEHGPLLQARGCIVTDQPVPELSLAPTPRRVSSSGARPGARGLVSSRSAGGVRMPYA